MTEPVSCSLGLVGRATGLLSTFSGRWRRWVWLSPWAVLLPLSQLPLRLGRSPPAMSWSSCPHFSVISSPGRAPSALSAFPSTVFFLPLWSPLSLLSLLFLHILLRIRWPKYWSFSFNINPSNEHPGLISFRIDWLDLLAVQGYCRE